MDQVLKRKGTKDMYTRTISNSDDIVDSRQVMERIEELQSEKDTHNDALAAELEADKDPEYDETTGARIIPPTWEEENPEDAAELASLLELAEDGENATSDWNYGATLIRDSHFKTYAQDFAEEIGAINKDASWPNTCIDWDEAAEELQQDYSSVEWDGVTFWIG